MFESKRRDKLYPTSSGELATDKQLWKINQLSMHINNLVVKIQEHGSNAYMDVYCNTMRINLPITKQDAWKAIEALQYDLETQQRRFESCLDDA